MLMPSERACVTEVKCTSSPLSRIRPLVGGWKPQMIFSRVDLPAPLSPIRPSTSPRPRCRFTSTSAVTAPYRLEMCSTRRMSSADGAVIATSPVSGVLTSLPPCWVDSAS